VISVTPLDPAGRRDLTVRLLEAIGSNGVPVVGFVNEYELYGFRKSDEGTPDAEGVRLLGMWLDQGLELGNHTFAHVDLHKTSLAAYEADVIRGETVTGALMRDRGLRPRYFRHPYLHAGRDLASKRTVERFLAGRGYRVAPVTVDNEDHVFAAAYSKAVAGDDADVARRVVAAYVAHTERVLDYAERLSVALFGREIRQIVLLHANALNADHFTDLAQMMKRRGYSFVTLEHALQDDAYASADRYTGTESIDWLARWALTRRIRTQAQVLTDIPDVPPFVEAAAARPYPGERPRAAVARERAHR
jgi:peptidoglycan/xylan/chitin deacetylase (PgdA/CDA1 family)